MAIIIADTSAIISLGLTGHSHLIKKIFGNLYIANAVWEELQNYDNPEFTKELLTGFQEHVVDIQTRNHLTVILDYGESESVILYEELKADYLLIDDNKARTIAESYNINCIGSIGLLIKAKQKGLVSQLRPIFEKWLKNERYFSVSLLNQVLAKHGERLLV